MKRAATIVRLLAGAVIAFASSTARAEELVLAVARLPVSLPVFVADAQGYFAAEGQKIRLLDCPTGRRCLQHLLDRDAHGHAGGDAALKEFAVRLEKCVRETDLVARFAGDEFVIVLEGILSAAEAQLVAEKVLLAMKSSFNILGSPLTVTTSVGVAMYGGGDQDMASLVSLADSALYAAKSEGRDRFSMAP